MDSCAGRTYCIQCKYVVNDSLSGCGTSRSTISKVYRRVSVWNRVV